MLISKFTHTGKIALFAHAPLGSNNYVTLMSVRLRRGHWYKQFLVYLRGIFLKKVTAFQFLISLIIFLIHNFVFF